VLIVLGLMLAGWVGVYAMKPKASVCPACGCMKLMPNRGGTRWQCEHCGEVFRLFAGSFVGRPGVRIAPALPAANIRETKPKE
jgi:ribosomal protein L37AE/L43A